MSIIYRQLVLRNTIDRIVYLREAQQDASYYGHETRLDPYSVRRDFPATIYKDRNQESGLPSEIVIFVDEDEVLQSLTPENFVQYAELIFEMDDDNNKLIVRGVPARLTDDILRLGAFGFPGRDYSHRENVIVRRCGFKVVTCKPSNGNEGCLLSSQAYAPCRDSEDKLRVELENK